MDTIKQLHLRLRKVAFVTDEKYLYRLVLMVAGEREPAERWEKEFNLTKAELKVVYDDVLEFFEHSANLQRIDSQKANYEKDFGVFWQWYKDEVV